MVICNIIILLLLVSFNQDS